MGKNNITRLYKDPNVEKQLNKANEKYKDNMEAMVTHGLVQPFSSHNSSSRKILANAQWTQRVDLLEPEYPFISTGYENHYGIHSSSYVKSTSNRRILAKISKFSSNPNHHYYLITVDDNRSNIHGEYIINKISLQLTHNGTMTITATKAPPRLL